MKKIQMVDLHGQYTNIKEHVDKAIQGVIDSSAFIKGSEVKLFETELAEYHKAKHAIGCANGTDALQIALMALDLSPGDEIISPDFTFISTVEVSAVLGLKPVLVDVDPDTFTISPEKIESAITSRTKAIVPVHLYGQCANMDKIMAIAEKHNLYVIEDNAQAIGADYTYNNGTSVKSGTIGHIGCTSFFPSKNLGCYGDGGAIVTNNDELAVKLRAIANHGMKVKYYNDYIGINSRLDTLQASILRVKLPLLDQYNKARQKAAQFYDKAFANHNKLKTPLRNPDSTHVFHQYTLLLDKSVSRDDFQSYLKDKEIPSMVYYPVPMHKQNAYQYLNCDNNYFPVTNDITQRVVSLPVHTELTDEQLNYITNTIIEYLK